MHKSFWTGASLWWEIEWTLDSGHIVLTLSSLSWRLIPESRWDYSMSPAMCLDREVSSTRTSRSARRFLDHMGLIVLPAAPMLSKSFTVILRPDEKKKRNKAEAPWRGVIHDIHDMWWSHCRAQVIIGHIDVLLHGSFTIWCARIIYSV